MDFCVESNPVFFVVVELLHFVRLHFAFGLLFLRVND
jgi:hypothetical protein